MLAGSSSASDSSRACVRVTGTCLLPTHFLSRFTGQTETVTPLAFFPLPLGLGGKVKIIGLKKKTELWCVWEAANENNAMNVFGKRNRVCECETWLATDWQLDP